MTTVRLLVGLALIGGILDGLSLPATAQELKPGEVIGPNNWKKIDGMVMSSYLQRIKEGQTIAIGAPSPVSLPQEYVEATRKYSGQVKINAQDGLDGYVAGQPFPDIDLRDPQAGLKVMWNFYWRWLSDDFSVAQVGRKGKNFKRVVIFEGGNEVEAETGLYNLRAMGRLSLPPIPAFPEAREKGIEYYFMQATLYPRDTAGTTFLLQRYRDPQKWDDMWVFVPSIRRVRRFPTSQRCSTLAPTDYNWDDSQMFNGKVPHFTYKLLGKQKMLVVSDWEGKPQPRRLRGDFFPQDMKWRPIDLLAVEQVSKDPSYCYSKRILWIEPTTSVGLLLKNYDRKGELWKELTVAYDGIDLKKFSGITKGERLTPVYVHLKNLHTGRDSLSIIPAGYTYNMDLTPREFSLATIEQGIRGASLIR